MAIAALYGSWRRLIRDRPLLTSTQSNNRGNKAVEAPQTIPRRGRRPSRKKWSEKKVDSEFDMVIVPPDGISVSGSESDADSDWSVGWFEPHSPRFTGDKDDTFAVLMPCYGSSSAPPDSTSQNHNAPPLPTPSQHHHHYR